MTSRSPLPSRWNDAPAPDADAADLRIGRICRLLSHLCAVAVALIALAVLAGWWLDVDVLKRMGPGLATMKFNTATVFVLCAVSLLFRLQSPATRQGQRIAAVCAGMVFLVAVLTLFEYVSGVDLGIDQLVLADTNVGAWPGRMSIATAFSFLLTGAALWLIDTDGGPSPQPEQWLAVLVLAIAGAALMGYLFNAHSLYRFAFFSSIALHTALLFALTGLGILFARPRRGLAGVITTHRIGGRIARLAIAAVVLVPVTFGWLSLRGHTAGLYEAEFGYALNSLVSVVILVVLLWFGARMLNQAHERLELRLRQTSHLAAIVESSADAIIGKNLDGVIRSWNAGAERLFGYSADEMIGHKIFAIIPAELYREEEQVLAAIQRGEGVERLETVRVRKDGSRIDVSLTVSPIRDADGTLTGASKVVRDISARKLAERRFELVVEAAPSAMIMSDSGGRIVLVNSQTERLFGYGRDELLGQPISMLIPDRFRQGHPGHVAGFFRDPRARAMGAGRELFGKRRDGSEVPVEIGLNPIQVPDGLFTLASIIDITERLQAEQRIRVQLEHLKLLDHITRATAERQDMQSILQVVMTTLEDSLPIDFGCVSLYDPDSDSLQDTHMGGRSTTVGVENLTAFRVKGSGLERCISGELIHEPELNGSPYPLASRLADAGLRSLVMAPLKLEHRVFGVLVAARRAAGAFSSLECEFLRQLGEHVALSANQVQLYGSLQRAYEQLRETQRSALQEERLRALGQMASGIAHDINNTLSPVSLYTEALLETEPNLSERARSYLETIQRAADDAAHTVARLREFSRRRETQIDLTPVELNNMVQQVIQLTRARWSDIAQQHGISIQVLTELEATLPPVMGVESEIREALTNLVLNAADAMPQGGTLTLRTRLQVAQSRHSVALEVVDTGVGMDELTRLRCLEPFFTTKGTQGTGLGLAMVFGVVQRHSAQVEIESSPGAGTTIRLLFPVQAQMPQPIRQPLAAPGVPRALSLLYVDDDVVLQKAVREALERDGHTVFCARGGEHGIAEFHAALARGAAYAAVISDLGMPHVDGRQVAAAVKKASPATPVILLTGWGRHMAAENDMPANVDRVLAKPPKMRELREALALLCA